MSSNEYETWQALSIYSLTASCKQSPPGPRPESPVPRLHVWRCTRRRRQVAGEDRSRQNCSTIRARRGSARCARSERTRTARRRPCSTPSPPTVLLCTLRPRMSHAAPAMGAARRVAVEEAAALLLVRVVATRVARTVRVVHPCPCSAQTVCSPVMRAAANISALSIRTHQG